MTNLLNEFKEFFPMANAIIEKRSTLPILTHIAVVGGKMMATDLEHRVEMPIDYAGEFTMDNKMLSTLVKGKHDSINVEQTIGEESHYDRDKRKTIKTPISKMTLLIDGKQKVEYKSKPLSEYPAGGKATKFRNIGQWDAEMVNYLLDLTQFVSKDELKPSLMGVSFVQDDMKVTLCATDGHRLKRVRRIPIKSHQVFNGIITPIAIKFIAMFMGKNSVAVAVNDTHMRFTLGNGVALFYRVIAERYVDYKSVFPKRESFRGTFRIERKALLDALKSGKEYANSTTHQIGLHIDKDGAVARIWSEDIETDIKWETEIPVKHEGDGITIGYNLFYLSGLLKSLDSEYVKFKYQSAVSAAIITGDDKRVDMLLMPIRLND